MPPDPPQPRSARQQSAIGLAGVCGRISVQCQLHGLLAWEYVVHLDIFCIVCSFIV